MDSSKSIVRRVEFKETDLSDFRRSGFKSSKDLNKYTLFNERIKIMYQTPAVESYANIHRAAAAFGYNPEYPAGAKVPVCPCCLLPVNTEQLSLTTDTTPSQEHSLLTSSFYLKSGVCLFFTFIKFSVVYLFIIFLTTSIFSLSMSLINEEYCALSVGECGYSSFIRYSPAKQAIKNHVQYLKIADQLHAILVLLSIIYFRFINKLQNQFHYAIKYDHQTQEDFTLMVKNIPHLIHGTGNDIHFDYEQTIKQLFESKIDPVFREKETQPQPSSPQQKHVQTAEIRQERQRRLRSKGSLFDVFQHHVINDHKMNPQKLDVVKSISLCFDLSDLRKIANIRDQYIQEMLEGKSYDGVTRGSMLDPSKKLKVINDQYLQLCKSYCLERNLNWTLTRFLGVAFVSMEFQHYKSYLLELYEKEPNQFQINNKQLILCEAPKPENIEWFNIQPNQSIELRNNMIAVLVVFFITLMGLLLLVSLNNEEFPVHGRRSSPFQTYIKQVSFGQHLLLAGIVYVINFTLRRVLRFMGLREQHQTKTARMKSLLIRYFMAQLINTTLIYFILSVLQGDAFLRDDGLVVAICYYILVMAPLALLSNLLRLGKKVEKIIWKIFNGSPRMDKEVQVNVNKLAEMDEFDFAERYSYYLVMTYMVVFFSYINPLCVAAAIVIFFLQFWIDKYNLFKCSSMTTELNFSLSCLVLRLMEISLLFFAAGNLYYSWKIQKEVDSVCLIGMAMAGLYVLIITLTPRSVQRIFCKVDRNLQADSYSNCSARGKFHHTYWLSNPATRFTEEPDINRPGKVIDYNFHYRIASPQDTARSRRSSQSF